MKTLNEMQFNAEDFKYIEAVDEASEEAVIRLDGRFGVEIDGAAIASEITFLDKVMGVKTINIHINTPGGVVFDSLSVVSAILSASAEVIGHNDGIVMSAGFHTFLACDRLMAFDYGVFMYHSARFPGVKRSQLSKSQKESLDVTNESMATLIANRLGKERNEVVEMLKDESYFQATDFEKKMGLAIEIKSSERKPSITANMSLEEMVAEFDKFNTNLKQEEMSETKLDITGVMAKLEIPADEKSPIEAINAKVDSVLASNVALSKSNEKLTEEKNNLEASLKVYTDKEAEAYVEGLINDKLVKKEAKEEILAAYIASPEAIKAVYDNIPAPAATETIVEEGKETRDEIEAKADEIGFKLEKDENGEVMDYGYYSKHKSDELKLMMREDRDRYNWLLEQYAN